MQVASPHFCLSVCFIPCHWSIGRRYTNNAVCNSSGVDASACDLVLVHSPNTVHCAAHADQILGKDADVVRRLHNCRFGRFGILNCVSSVRVLWFRVSLRISTVCLSIFCVGDRLCGRRIEFYQKHAWHFMLQCTNTTAVLLSPLSATIPSYQVCIPLNTLLCDIVDWYRCVIGIKFIYIHYYYDRDKFKFLRLMVLQMPIVQGILLALLNVLNAIDTVSHQHLFANYSN